jgi:DNA-binding GntR family transcriptional regulator
MAKVFKDRAKVKKLLDHHQRIFNAIKNHFPDKARERTLEHLNYVESEVKASAEKRN